MKTILRKNRLFTIALFAFFGMAALPAIASEDPALPVEFVFVGKMKSQPVYQLTVNGDPLQNEFAVIIRDEYGNVLYWENIRSEKYTKKFLFNPEEMGDNTLQLEVYSRKTKKSVLYKLSQDTRLVQEMTVYKVN